MNKAKAKGSHGEYEVRDLLQAQINEVYEQWNLNIVAGVGLKVPPILKRNLEQTRGVGYDLEGLPWLALEVKRQEQANQSRMDDWWEQTKASAQDGLGSYVREPVLFYRKNHCPWRIRMFGYLIVRDAPGGERVKTIVDINLPAFLAYFRGRMLRELGKEND